MCRQKDAKTVQGCALKTRSPCCAGYGFRFFGHEKSKSVLHADGLKKSLRRIFIAAALERRTANHHPCPLLGGGGLGGGKANTLRSAAWLSASPDTPRVLLSVYSCQPIRAPFPPSGKGVGGKGKCACGYLGSVSVRSTDLFFLIIEGKTNPYPAQPATGVLGQSPKRVLVPFTRVKGTPRRRAVQTKLPKILSPPSGARKLFHPTQKQLTTLPLHQGLNGKQNCFT